MSKEQQQDLLGRVVVEERTSRVLQKGAGDSARRLEAAEGDINTLGAAVQGTLGAVTKRVERVEYMSSEMRATPPTSFLVYA